MDSKELEVFFKARRFYSNQDWKNAEIEYRKLLKINPKSASYHNSYSCILSNSGSIKATTKALKHSAIAVELEPNMIHYRLTKIDPLIQLNKHKETQNEFEILFKTLQKKNELHILWSLDHTVQTLHKYSNYLLKIGQHQEAIKYSKHAIKVSHKNGHSNPILYTSLSHLYQINDELTKSLNILQSVQHKQEIVSFQWKFGTVYLKLQQYEKSYSCLKYVYNYCKQQNCIQSKLFIYVDLMKCCIESNKFSEADALWHDAVSIISPDQSVLKYSNNNAVGEFIEFMKCYRLIKMGGVQNILDAIRLLWKVVQHNEESFINIRNAPPVWFYLGLAYKKLNDTAKAKEMFFHCIHLHKKNTLHFWEFCLILWNDKEFYLCRKYANISWKRSKEILCISKIYPILKNKLKRKIKDLKCNYCKRKNYRKKNKKLKVCKGCHRIFYCNKQCQKLDWMNNHRLCCNKLWCQLEKQKLKDSINTEMFTRFEQLKKIN